MIPGGSRKRTRGGGGSKKRARGSGGSQDGGVSKRQIKSNFQQPTIRRSSAALGGRLLGTGVTDLRNRSTAAASTAPAPSSVADETFNLVNGNSLHFATIIRLSPDLVDEIKRAEAHGATTQIKFGSKANNSAGNVISVGGKDFRFTWSRDSGDLCDIYEERQSEEDGIGLLVESGSAWRKVNVQRVLDESTKNHVKMRSEEAERKSKSRKTIVLDSRNTSTKSEMKAAAAEEGTPCKMAFKQPPQRKRKVEPLSVTPSNGPSTSSGPKNSTSSKVSDLQCMLLTLLMDNQSNGMTLKALDKSVQEAFPNSTREIETLLKRVAIFRAPGRYFLKPGMEREALKKYTAGSGSSPENKDHAPSTHNMHEILVLETSLSIRTDTKASEGKLQLSSKLEGAPTSWVRPSPDCFVEQKASDQIEDPTGVSSDSESASDKSRSRSPVECESDLSSNSKSSNGDLDIMGSDSDRGGQKVSENGLLKFPISLTSQDAKPSQFWIGEKEYTHVSDILEIEKDLPDVEMTDVNTDSRLIENQLVTEGVVNGKQDDKPATTKSRKTGNMHKKQVSFSMDPLFAKDVVQDKYQTHVDSQPFYQQCSAVDHSVVEYHSNKAVEVNGEERYNMKGGSLVIFDGESNNGKVCTGAAHDDRSNIAFQEKRNSSADEISSSYFKYEKKEPELRVPIKCFIEYKEYVEEYHEKYDKYCSLSKNLKSYWFEFREIGKDLNAWKGKDMEKYYEILARLKDSYCQHAPTHKRLKKIFIVLHEELKHLKQMINDFVASNGSNE
ncbi:unnamed protein product [Cuscuta epithymum]|uniref:OCEL domain-containing protein n=1 Tax=Cuscuta epithymum TaxID=186058 RepID=A0AAV0C7A6_9ASTE|nr:unnamed protein product [Cuscuta epithymum]